MCLIFMKTILFEFIKLVGNVETINLNCLLSCINYISVFISFNYF